MSSPAKASMVWAAPGGQPDCSPEPQLEVASRVLARAGAAGSERWRAGEERWMEGMSQSAARRQLRKPPVFTFLLKEIVGLALEPWSQDSRTLA